jgi:microcystin degradation protein MlrC
MAKKRVLVVECQQEVSSFNPVPSRYAEFQIRRGDTLFADRRGSGTYVGGALAILEAEPGLELVPVYGAFACSAGELAAEDYARLRSELLNALAAAARGGVDAVLFALHGAMGAKGELDPEGDLLERARAMLGPAVPFVLSLDLHGILTGRMLTHAPAFTTLKTYPHVDLADTGERAARLLLRVLNEDARPVAARLRLPMLVRGDECITETGIYGRYMEQTRQIEALPDVLAAAIFIGNPFTDVPELCCQAVVVTDNDPELAERKVQELADGFWEHRADIQARLIGLDAAIAEAKGLRGTVVFTDAADATSSGATGDSNLIVKGLIEQGYQGRVLAPLTDAPGVEQAFAVGVGGVARFSLGGSLDPRFAPLALEARVAMLSDGNYTLESWGTPEIGGRCAVLEAGNVTLVLSSRPVQLFDRSLFLAHGRDPKDFDLVVVKSPHTQKRFFEDYAVRNFNIDVAGSTSANLPTLGHTRCARPIYPLDPDTTVTSKIEIYP